MTNDERREKVYQLVRQFFIDQKVTCEEAIYQVDHVIEGAYDLLGECFRVIEEDLPMEEETE